MAVELNRMHDADSLRLRAIRYLAMAIKAREPESRPRASRFSTLQQLRQLGDIGSDPPGLVAR